MHIAWLIFMICYIYYLVRIISNRLPKLRIRRSVFWQAKYKRKSVARLMNGTLGQPNFDPFVSQGELVDSIEANVESSAVHVEEGADQLRQAERYQVLNVVLNRFSYLKHSYVRNTVCVDAWNLL